MLSSVKFSCFYFVSQNFEQSLGDCRKCFTSKKEIDKSQNSNLKFKKNAQFNFLNHYLISLYQGIMMPLVTRGPLFSSQVEDNFSTLSHVRCGEHATYLLKRKIIRKPKMTNDNAIIFFKVGLSRHTFS